MAARHYQTRIQKLLAEIFGKERVRHEWNIRSGASDRFKDSATYAPRVDIAVGPFNMTSDAAENDAHNILEAGGHELVQEIISVSQSQNEGHFVRHQNPRCLLAIEIEFSGSSKHILGDITNASMMGLVGVVIGPSENINKIERVAQYVRRLRTVKKAPPDLFANVAFFETNHFRKLLQKYRNKVGN